MSLGVVAIDYIVEKAGPYGVVLPVGFGADGKKRDNPHVAVRLGPDDNGTNTRLEFAEDGLLVSGPNGQHTKLPWGNPRLNAALLDQRLSWSNFQEILVSPQAKLEYFRKLAARGEANAALGRKTVLAVTGMSGSGKSTIIRELVEFMTLRKIGTYIVECDNGVKTIGGTRAREHKDHLNGLSLGFYALREQTAAMIELALTDTFDQIQIPFCYQRRPEGATIGPKRFNIPPFKLLIVDGTDANDVASLMDKCTSSLEQLVVVPTTEIPFDIEEIKRACMANVARRSRGTGDPCALLQQEVRAFMGEMVHRAIEGPNPYSYRAMISARAFGCKKPKSAN
jgi:hypothetical protein